MLFRQLFDIKSHSYTYLIASITKRKALLIDPVLEQITLYQQLLKELDLKLVFTLDTHTHADHITASGLLRQQNIGCRIARGEHTQAEYVDIHLKEGESLELDEITLMTLYTPGHTDDSYSYQMQDCVFTGDTLLIRSTGRTDFQAGNPYQQYDSLFNRLLTLPEQTYVYPAHDYHGMTVSTIGEEKRYNPRLQVKSAEQYVEVMNHLNLSLPAMMERAVPANLRSGIVSHED